MSIPTFVSGEVLTADKLNQLGDAIPEEVPTVVQTTGSSQSDVMSQKAVTDMVTPGSWTTLSTTYGGKWRKIGNIVEIRIAEYDGNGKSFTGTTTYLGTLPTGSRPSDTCRTALWGHKIDNSGTSCMALNVDNGGVVAINAWSANGTYDSYGGTIMFTV